MAAYCKQKFRNQVDIELFKYPDDLEKAIFTGVHTPGDSDSIASLAGALIGARIKDKSFKEKFNDKNACQVEELSL